MPRNKSYRKKPDTGIHSFRRRLSSRIEPGSSILVVTEGENTEPVYFDFIRQRFAAPTVELVSHGAGRGDPRALVDAALKVQKDRKRQTRAKKLGINRLEDFDAIWIVFDTDVLDPQKLHDGIAYAQSKGIQIAHSEPCFEYWLLLHGTFTTAMMVKCENVIPFLEETFGWRNYSREGKKEEQVKALIEPIIDKHRIALAVKHAKRVRSHHQSASTPFPANPSTDVDRLIHAINEAVSLANKFL